MKWYQKREVQIAWLVALLAFPVMLWALPSAFFDESDIIVCPSRAFFGVECLGCGMTRGVMHAHHAEITEAIYYNLGSPFVYTVLIGIWVWLVFKVLKRLGMIKGKNPDTA